MRSKYNFSNMHPGDVAFFAGEKKRSRAYLAAYRYATRNACKIETWSDDTGLWVRMVEITKPVMTIQSGIQSLIDWRVFPDDLVTATQAAHTLQSLHPGITPHKVGRLLATMNTVRKLYAYKSTRKVTLWALRHGDSYATLTPTQLWRVYKKPR